MWQAQLVGRGRCDVELGRIPTKQRPRWNGRGRPYTPAPTAEAEEGIRRAWLRQVGSRWAAHRGEARMAIVIERPLAKSNPRRWAGKADVLAPDLDNTAKLVFDALNGVAYADDRQVTQLSVIRLPRAPYGSPCGMRVSIDYYMDTYKDDSKDGGTHEQ